MFPTQLQSWWEGEGMCISDSYNMLIGWGRIMAEVCTEELSSWVTECTLCVLWMCRGHVGLFRTGDLKVSEA